MTPQYRSFLLRATAGVDKFEVRLGGSFHLGGDKLGRGPDTHCQTYVTRFRQCRGLVVSQGLVWTVSFGRHGKCDVSNIGNRLEIVDADFARADRRLYQHRVGKLSDGIAVRLGPACLGPTDAASGAGYVLHDDLRAEMLLQVRGGKAHDHVRASTGFVGDDQANGFFRIPGGRHCCYWSKDHRKARAQDQGLRGFHGLSPLFCINASSSLILSGFY